MAPKVDKSTDRSPKAWRNYKRWGATKTFVGIVNGRDAESAIETAIARFEISDPEHQSRLVAEPRVD